MLVGTTLPQFQPDPELAVVTAARAEELGLDGVFIFNHLWPIGRPDGDVLECFTLLAAVAQETSRIRVGTLVARVGLLPDAVLLNTFASANKVAGAGRLIAGIGTGDHLSAAENLAYGIEYPAAAERLDAAGRVAAALRAEGIETWVGGRSEAIRRVAVAAADALNVWDATPAEVATEGAGMPRITWGGQVDLRAGGAALTKRLAELEAAGADFAVCSPVNTDWSIALETLAEVRAAGQ